MADNLPRPVTPGPWLVHTDAGEDSAEVICHAPGEGFMHAVAIRQAGDDISSPWPVGVFPGGAHPDIAAIAALPERIRRMDAVRALCDRAIVAGKRVNGHTDDVWFGEATGRAAMGREILALLDGEAGR